MIGASSADIRLTALVERTGKQAELPYVKEEMPSYYSGQVQKVSDAEFTKLLGHEIPADTWSGQLGMNDAICQMYYAKSGLARLIYKILTHIKKKSEEKGKPDLNVLFIYNMPFRGIAKMTGGAVSMDMVHGMVTAVNGHVFKGLKQIIGGYFANQKANKAYEAKISGK